MDKLSIDEKYGRAVQSSHLECTDELGDVHTLIAAGMVREGLGISLLRLRIERDSVSKLPGALLVQTSLMSWRSTLEMLSRAAVTMADRAGVSAREIEIRAVASHALDLYLNPNCENCSGVGTVGGYATPQFICPVCDGSKKRRLFWGRRDDFDNLARDLEAVIADKTSRARQRITSARRQLSAALQSN